MNRCDRPVAIVHIVNNVKNQLKFWNSLYFRRCGARARACPLGWAFRIFFIGARQSFSVTFVAFLRHRHNHGPKITTEKVYDNFILATRTIRSTRLHSSGTLDSIFVKTPYAVRTHKIKGNERTKRDEFKCRYSHAPLRHICSIVYLAGRLQQHWFSI